MKYEEPQSHRKYNAIKNTVSLLPCCIITSIQIQKKYIATTVAELLKKSSVNYLIKTLFYLAEIYKCVYFIIIMQFHRFIDNFFRQSKLISPIVIVMFLTGLAPSRGLIMDRALCTHTSISPWIILMMQH